MGPEHRIRFDSEFTADRESQTDWQAYLRIENELAAELETKIVEQRASGNLLDRYAKDSLTFPDRFDGNWNRSYELAAAAPVGVAVLLHGLTDSPYSMLATAEALAGAGFNVVVPRMPGHGFAVGSLQQARSEDWSAAVRIAIRHGMNLPAADRAMIVVGYSNGGLLAIDYALQCARNNLRCPDKLVLISPAITVSRYASVANLHSAISWMPYFEKYAWFSILPEIDPFKFSSFPKRAGREIYNVSRRVLDMLADNARTSDLPPMLAFQSIVDSTVGSMALTSILYSRLPQNGSKQIIYDVNRGNAMLHLMQNLPAEPEDYFSTGAPFAYDITIVKNRDGNSLSVDLLNLPSGNTNPQIAQTTMQWPDGVYSLSHIALPFRPDDQLYGDGNTRNGDNPEIVIGAMSPRGESGVLKLPPSYFLRIRHNPFHQYQAQEIIRWLTSE
jgi:alpha-beta hydrolase superfamily lysophospholipase